MYLVAGGLAPGSEKSKNHHAVILFTWLVVVVVEVQRVGKDGALALPSFTSSLMLSH